MTEYDIVTGARINHFTADSEVTHLIHGYSHNVLCAACRNGSFHVWDLSSGQLESLHAPTRSHERRSVVCMQASRTQPTLFYSKVKSNHVTVLPMFSNSHASTVDYTHKKQITCLAAHPSKDLLATASIDGQIKIWNTKTHQTHIVFDESGSSRRIKREPVTALAFYPASVQLDKISSSLLTSLSSGPPLSARGSKRDTMNMSASAGNSELELLATATRDGRIQIWQLIPSIGHAKSLATINIEDRIWITSLYFHPMYPCLVVLNTKGCMRFISTGALVSNFLQGRINDNPHAKMGLLQPFDLIKTFYASTHDASNSLSNLRYKNFLVPMIQCTMDERTGDIAFFGKISSLCPSTHHDNIITNYFSIYNIVDTKNPQSTLPLCQQFQWPLSIFAHPKPNEPSPPEVESRNAPSRFEIPLKDVLYMDTCTALPHCMLMSYPLSASSSNTTTPPAVNRQLIKAGQSFEDFRRCVRARFPSYTYIENDPNSLRTDAMLLFFERSEQVSLSSDAGSNSGLFQFIHVDIKNKEHSPYMNGMDGGFLKQNDGFQSSSRNSSDRYIVLDESCRKVSLVSRTEIEETISLEDSIGRVFTSDIGPQIIYFHMDRCALGYAVQFGQPNHLQFDHSGPLFYLRKREKPLEIYWQRDQLCREECLIAVLTTERICILNAQFQQLATTESPANELMYFHSCLWVGNVLLYNTSSNLYCLTPNSDYRSIDGGAWNSEVLDDFHGERLQHLCTLDTPNAVLCGVLADRVVFACLAQKKPEIYCRYISLAEPLTMGVLAIPHDRMTTSEKLELLKSITARFDCSSFSQKALLRLEQHGFADLATALVSESQYTPTWDIRFRMAKSANKFSNAFDILKNQFLEAECVTPCGSGSFSLVSESSIYMPLFVELAQTCIDYAQYDVALKCIEMINDMWLMLHIFSATHNVKGLRLLSQRCMQSEEFYGVYLACQSFLKSSASDMAPPEEEEMAMSVSPDPAREFKLMEIDLQTMSKYSVRSTNEGEREFHLCSGGSKGTMYLHDPNQQDTLGAVDSHTAPSLDQPDNVLPIMDLKDLAKWMGFVDKTTTSDQSEQDWDRVEFNQDDFGANKDLQSTISSTNRSDAGDSDDETTTMEGLTQDEIRKMYQINEEDLDPRFDKMRRVKVDMSKDFSENKTVNLSFRPPTSRSQNIRRIGSTRGTPAVPSLNFSSIKTTEESDTASSKGDADDIRSEVDEDGYTVRQDIDAIRRQYMGGSSDDDDDDEDDDDVHSARNKRRLFRKIKISSKAIHQEADSSSLSKATIGLGLGGLASPTSASRRRRVGGLSSLTPSSSSSSSSLNQSSSSIGDDEGQRNERNSGDISSPTSGSSAGFNVRALAQEAGNSSNAIRPVAPVSFAKPEQQINPGEKLKIAMSLMERGKFSEARKSVHEAISILITDATQVLKKQNIILCVRYKLLITMLRKIHTLEQHYRQEKSAEILQEIAMTTILINTIPQILAKHRVTCKNMAIKRNMMANNFGIAASMLRQLLPDTPPQYRQTVEDRLKVCEQDNHSRNANSQLAALIPQYGLTEGCIMFCWFKFILIHAARESFLECTYCNAHYSYDEEEVERQEMVLGQMGAEEGKSLRRLTAVAMPGTKCPHCLYGDLELKGPQVQN